MTAPDELADALWSKKPVRKDPLGRNDHPDAVFVTKTDLRTLAKAAWEAGFKSDPTGSYDGNVEEYLAEYDEDRSE